MGEYSGAQSRAQNVSAGGSVVTEAEVKQGRADSGLAPQRHLEERGAEPPGSRVAWPMPFGSSARHRRDTQQKTLKHSCSQSIQWRRREGEKEGRHQRSEGSLPISEDTAQNSSWGRQGSR